MFILLFWVLGAACLAAWLFKHTALPLIVAQRVIGLVVARVVRGLPLAHGAVPSVLWHGSTLALEGIALAENPANIQLPGFVVSQLSLRRLHVGWQPAASRLVVSLSGLHAELLQRAWPADMGKAADVASPYTSRLAVLEDLLWRPLAPAAPLMGRLAAWFARVAWAFLAQKLVLELENCTLRYRQAHVVGPPPPGAARRSSDTPAPQPKAAPIEDAVQLYVRTACLQPDLPPAAVAAALQGGGAWASGLDAATAAVALGKPTKPPRKTSGWSVLRSCIKFSARAGRRTDLGRTALRIAGVNICVLSGTNLAQSPAVTAALTNGGLPKSSPDATAFIILRQWFANVRVTVTGGGDSGEGDPAAATALESGRQQALPAISIISSSGAAPREKPAGGGRQAAVVAPPSPSAAAHTADLPATPVAARVPPDPDGGTATTINRSGGDESGGLSVRVDASLKSFVPMLEPAALAALLRISRAFGVYSRCCAHWQVC